MTEKHEAIRLVEQLKDIELLRLVKKILLSQKDNTLDDAIAKGLRSSSDNKVVPHEEVMSFFKEKYK